MPARSVFAGFRRQRRQAFGIRGCYRQCVEGDPPSVLYPPATFFDNDRASILRHHLPSYGFRQLADGCGAEGSIDMLLKSCVDLPASAGTEGKPSESMYKRPPGRHAGRPLRPPKVHPGCLGA
jgi:hypothetical protein